MLWQLVVGGAVSVANIAIHALVTTATVAVARAVAPENKPHSSLLPIAFATIPTVSVFMATHALEVFVWALAYRLIECCPRGDQPGLFRICQLHNDAWIWGRHSGGPLALVWVR